MSRLTLATQTKIFLLLFANSLAFFHLPIREELLCVGFLLFIVFFFGQYRQALFFGGLYACCLAVSYIILKTDGTFFLGLFTFFASTFRRLLPLLLIASFLIKTTQVTSLIYTLGKWRVPDFILIPLSVLFRFFPTLKNDYRHIRDAMRFRGIALSSIDLIRHPWQTLEYILVPLLMTATLTAKDLSAAALTRGLSTPSMPTSLSATKIKKIDIFLLGISVLLVFIVRSGMN